MRELKVGEYHHRGELLIYGNDVIRVVIDNDISWSNRCKKCELLCTSICDSIVCSSGDRYDSKNVIYAKIDELEEGEEFKEENYAK